MSRSAANRQGNVMELSGNFTLSGEWSPCHFFVSECTKEAVNLLLHHTSSKRTRGQSNLTESASRGAHSPVRSHPRGSKVVPLNSWGRVSY